MQEDGVDLCEESDDVVRDALTLNDVIEEHATDLHERNIDIGTSQKCHRPIARRETSTLVLLQQFCPGFQQGRVPSEKGTFSAVSGPSKGHN